MEALGAESRTAHSSLPEFEAQLTVVTGLDSDGVQNRLTTHKISEELGKLFDEQWRLAAMPPAPLPPWAKVQEGIATTLGIEGRSALWFRRFFEDQRAKGGEARSGIGKQRRRFVPALTSSREPDPRRRFAISDLVL